MVKARNTNFDDKHNKQQTAFIEAQIFLYMMKRI